MARPRRARYGLTEAQLRELCSEMHTILYGTHFASDEERRAAWFDHREEIRAFYHWLKVTNRERETEGVLRVEVGNATGIPMEIKIRKE